MSALSIEAEARAIRKAIDRIHEKAKAAGYEKVDVYFEGGGCVHVVPEGAPFGSDSSVAHARVGRFACGGW